MAKDLTVIETGLNNLDLSRLKEFNIKLNNLGENFNKMMAASYMRDFILAYDLCNAMYARAQQFTLNAKAAVDEAEAIAFLDKAPIALSNKSEKPTVEAKKAYVAMDADVMLAKDVYARAISTETFLKNSMFKFKDALDVVKVLTKDTFLTPHEGMK
jgi:hypothetical protein